MTKKRKPPIRHRVKSHTREGRKVSSFMRGTGTSNLQTRRKVTQKTAIEKKEAIFDHWRKTRYDEDFKLRTVLREAKGYIRDGKFSDRGEDEVMVAWNTAINNFPDPRRRVSLYEANLVDEYYDKLEKYAKRVRG